MARPRVRKAVIPVAGLGTRFLPATKSQPKEMLPLIDTPVIHYVVQEVLASGIDTILLVTGRGKRAIEDYFDRSVDLEEHLTRDGNPHLLAMVREIANIANVHFVRQKAPLGLGHAVLCARQFVGDEPFAVLLADEVYTGAKPCLRQLIDSYERTSASTLAVRQVPLPEVSRYGVADLELQLSGLHRVRSLVEKPRPENAPSNYALLGRYVVEPEIFDCLEQVEPGVNGEIQFTDGLRQLCKSRGMHALEVEGNRYDVGDKLGYLQAIVDFALTRQDLREEFLAYLQERIKPDIRSPLTGGHTYEQG